MQKNVTRLFSISLAIMLVFSVSIPAFASNSEYVSRDFFWNWVASSSEFAQKYLGYIGVSGSGSTHKVCPKSDDSYHHASSYVKNYSSGYYDCICQYCGEKFTAYEKDLSDAYDNYVSTLPASQITKEDLYRLYFENFIYGKDACLNDKHMFYETYLIATGADRFRALWSCYTLSTYSTLYLGDICAKSSLLSVPYTGTYDFHCSVSYQGASFSSSSNANRFQLYSEDGTQVFTGSSTSSTRISLTAGKYFCYLSTRFAFSGLGISFPATFSGSPYLVFLGGDGFSPGSISNVYGINSRPTSITGGNYGIVGDNNQIVKVEDNSTIVNETNNTYYNPATGTTAPITNWSYDYSDRSYNVTLESGDTSTITYGDENISITETTINESGDTITNNYIIYYILDGSGTENPPAVCDHTWTETSTTPATCTVPGSRLSTCSKCQQTKTESIPALGHDWQVKETVTTEYGEDGLLVQEGYTIFECTNCHEQYKSTDGIVPSDSPNNLLTKVEEALQAVADLFNAFSSSITEFFSGFTDFLGAVFPFLPQEFYTILGLGLLLLIVAAVFRKFLT